jgi:glycerol-3-phosphate acyltransferase PlsY
MLIIQIILTPLFAYLLGSIPFGLVLTKVFCGIDIRKRGSGNIGATNVRRIAGTKLGLITLFADMLKGFGPVWLALGLFPAPSVWADILVAVTCLGAFGGHLYPVFLKGMDGGKGVATAMGCLLAISPMALLVTLLTYILLLSISGRSSVGSLAAAAMMPLSIWHFHGSRTLQGVALIMAVMIVIRHRDNIKRLAAGQEPKVW